MLVIHLGISGFPIGNAPIQRIRLTFKALKIAGCSPLIINKHSVAQTLNIRKINRFQGIPYISTSLSTSRPDNFIVRNLNKFSGYLGELILLVKKRRHIHTAIFYESSFYELIYYRILSKILRFKLIIQYVELRSAIPRRQKKLVALNDWLFDNYCFAFCDGMIVISEFLKNRVISKTKTLPVIKIPAINDFDEFKLKTPPAEGNYLMYCGTLAYLPIVNFVQELYCQLCKRELYTGSLLLAIGGSREDENGFKSIAEKIESSGFKGHIILKKNVPHQELIPLYLGAELLIVPMRNTLQDIAGFHHKIGEYTAAAKPIISTNIGELKHYFTDGVSAILADEYSVDSYLAKLSVRLSSKDELNIIAENGHKVGLHYLNYKTYSTELKNFILSIR